MGWDQERGRKGMLGGEHSLRRCRLDDGTWLDRARHAGTMGTLPTVLSMVYKRGSRGTTGERSLSLCFNSRARGPGKETHLQGDDQPDQRGRESQV